MKFLVGLSFALLVASETCAADNEVEFWVQLVPYLAIPSERIDVRFDGRVLAFSKGLDRDEIRLTESISEDLAKLIAETDKNLWYGWWYYGALDGVRIRSGTTVGEESLSFEGSNGCPPGFSAILFRINEIVGQNLFPSYWAKTEEEAEHYEKDWVTEFTRDLKAGRATHHEMEQYEEKYRIKDDSEQGGADQPATDPELKAQSPGEPQPEGEARRQ